jgi:hypothetical protein
MKAILIAAAVALAAPAAYAADLRFSPVQSEGHTVEYHDGIASIASQLSASRAELGIMRPSASTKLNPLFLLVVENTGPETVTLLPDSVTVTTSTGAKLAVLTVEDLQQVVRKRVKQQKVALALMAIGQGLQAASAAQANYSGTSTAHVMGPGGFATVHQTYTGTAYNPYAAMQAQLAAQDSLGRQAQNVAAMESAGMEDAMQTGFKAETLNLGEKYATPLPLEILKDKKVTALKLRVALGAEVHEFEVAVAAR